MDVCHINKNSNAYLNSWFFIFIGAIVLYCQQAWVSGFFQDGYLYATFGKNAAMFDFWLVPHLSDSTYNEFKQHTPGLFIIEGLFFKLFGVGYLQARLFGAIFAIATVLVLYFWVKRERGALFAWVSSSILLLMPPLIKKSRFPNMDFPLMFFILCGLIFYFNALKGKKYSWYICGIFWGLSLLIKGPMAVLLPLSIFIHIIFTKKWKTLFNIHSWGGLLLGILIFSSWPIALHLVGKDYIFHKYLESIFVFSIGGSRGITEYSFFFGITFLLKRCCSMAFTNMINLGL